MLNKWIISINCYKEYTKRKHNQYLNNISIHSKDNLKLKILVYKSKIITSLMCLFSIIDNSFSTSVCNWGITKKYIYIHRHIEPNTMFLCEYYHICRNIPKHIKILM